MSAIDEVAAWPGTHAAAVVTAGPNGAVVASSSGPTAARFQLASVTKVLASLAVLVELDAGRCRLDDHVGPPGSTLAHLLSHASGLPLDGTTPVAACGSRRIYSNTGIELAVAHAAAHAGVRDDELIATNVLAPLGMADTVVDGSVAWSGISTVDDMARLAAELLAPRLVPTALAQRQREVAFPRLAGVLPGFGRQDPCDWGLGVEVKGTKHPHWTGASWPASSFGHFGRAGGFVVADAEAATAVVTLGDEPFGGWAISAWPAFTDAVRATHAGR